jgi:predicted DsbA family dithiol-disulfide isomerase
VDRKQSYIKRLGEQGAKDFFDRLSQLGSDLGINFRLGGRIGSTRDSHRLVHGARQKGAETQNRLVEELFKTFFERNEDITDRNLLIYSAKRAGIEARDAERWLDDDDAGKEVDAEANEARANGISGVPNFTLNDRFEISGAQQSIAFVSLFERLVKMEQRSRA